ncbi:hypothetical protein D3C85_1610510 [compost metagenome]
MTALFCFYDLVAFRTLHHEPYLLDRIDTLDVEIMPMLGNVFVKVINSGGILIDHLITAMAFVNQVIEVFIGRAMRRSSTGKVFPI